MPPTKPTGRPHPWVEGETPAYHITHVENLASIVDCGHLYAMMAAPKRDAIRSASLTGT